MKKKLLLFFALSGFIFSGCEMMDCFNDQIAIDGQTHLVGITFIAENNTAHAQLTAYWWWEVVSKPDWVTVDPMSGPGKPDPTIITITAEPYNVVGGERYGEIVITDHHSMSDLVIPVWQYGPAAPPPDVFIAGKLNGEPTLWINGAKINLSANDGVANSVFVANDGKIYVAGCLGTGWGASDDNEKARLWIVENGAVVAEIDLTEINLPSNAYSVFVTNDNKVYVSGYETVDCAAVVWLVEGVAVTKSYVFTFEYWSRARSVVVANNTIYAAGNWENSHAVPSNCKALLWKVNLATDAKTTITLSENARANAYSVAVDSDGNAYVTGKDVSPPSPTSSNLNCVAVWKVAPDNAVTTFVVETDDDGFDPQGRSIFLADGKVYVAGYMGNVSDPKAKLWVMTLTGTIIEDETTQITTNARANSVFVTPDGTAHITG
ncbi:MAG: SBBP repeat-containing protein, partial [Prevotellaceae bacterium]|nr:SBBP repeat-containing protein [Prevotellaceae bacterium]